MKNFIDIDGNLIDSDSINCVTKIRENYGFELSTHARFEFRVEYGFSYLLFVESFKVGLFSNIPKSQVEKDNALQKLSNRRDEILKLIKSAE